MSGSPKIRWWAVFAVRRSMDESDRYYLLASEHSPFESLVDITDCCAASRVSAEVSYERLTPTAEDPLAGERVAVGWIDELGRLHARRRTVSLAEKLAALIAEDAGSAVDMVFCHRSDDTANGSSVASIELWAHVGRDADEMTVAIAKTERAEARTHHRFLIGEVRVG